MAILLAGGTTMDLGLRDHVVLVSGGAAGIGRATVDQFLEDGARVAIIDLAAKPGGDERQLGIVADLTDESACRKAVDAVVDHFGRLDVLVNNAGVNDSVSLNAGSEAFTNSLKKNLVHFYTLAHLARPHLAKRGGAIVNVGSKVSVTGQGGTSGYAAAKGGVLALTREWAVELAGESIRVNAVLPAEVWTEMYARWLDSTDDPATEKLRIEKSIPLGRRFTTSQEIADAIVWLASARASHTTGQHIFVDGGYSHLDRRATLD